ncbi:MAG: hypothetical protein ABI843_12700 [Dokdonella sp.]
MEIHWMKVLILDREISGRDFAQRRAAVFEAIRVNTTALAETAFEEGQLGTFFLFTAQRLFTVVQQVRGAIAPGDIVLHGRLGIEAATAIRLPGPGAGDELTPQARLDLFAGYWRR